MLAIDLVVCVSITVFVVMRIYIKSQSSDLTQDTLGRISSIPWADVTIHPDEKTDVFWDAVQDLLDLMATEAYLKTLCTFCLIFLLIRFLIATSCHPRLALLTGTITYAFDDLYVGLCEHN